MGALWLLVWGGLLFFRNPARYLLAAIWLVRLLFLAFAVPAVAYTGFGGSVALLTTLVGGALLGLAFCSPLAAEFGSRGSGAAVQAIRPWPPKNIRGTTRSPDGPGQTR